MLEHPYRDLPPSSEWQRGNLHAHTTRSDGRQDPQAVIDAYSRMGYHFLMISDHDILTAEKEYRQWEDCGLALIPGNEISKNGPHMLHVGARERIEPDADRQAVIENAIRSGGFIICNHPDWQKHFNHFPMELMENLSGYTGLEIFNGTIGRLQGSQYALHKWDRLLSSGRRCWGFATDDSHLAGEDLGLGWIVVCSGDRSPDRIISAIQEGRFYASTGVTIEEISVSENRIQVSTGEECRLIAVIDHGRRIAVVDGRRIDVEIPEEAGYVRIECWGSAEQFAWTQPVFQTGADADSVGTLR